ncbi:MAG: hypothetical protein KBC67_02145 [Candidatus Pacebacteria bacterium]|nr:hypothetical protein [Candidatus Paceibacterota bacterium]
MDTKNHKKTSMIVVAAGLAMVLGVGYMFKTNMVMPIDQSSSPAAVGRSRAVVVAPPCQISPSIAVSPISSIGTLTPVAGNNNDFMTFQFKFSIRANACDAYISANPSWITNGAFDGMEVLQKGTNTYMLGVSFAWVTADRLPATTANGNWRIPAGTQENFTAYFTSRGSSAGGPGSYRGFLKQIRWNETDSAAAFRIFTSGLGTTTTTTPYTTSYISVN